MLESLCVDLINELFLTKYKFLLAMKLNSMLSAKCQSCSKNQVDKDDDDDDDDDHKGESPSPGGSSTPVPHVQEKYNSSYANFCNLKRKEMRKKKIKKKNFKRLRKKCVRDLQEHSGVNCVEGEKDQAPTCEAICLMSTGQGDAPHDCVSHDCASPLLPPLLRLRSKQIAVGRKTILLHLKEKCILKKKKKKNCIFTQDGNGRKVPMATPSLDKSGKKKKVYLHMRMLYNELCEYICKDFYPFLPLYNFEEEPLPPNKNRINFLISKEKMKKIARSRKKIKGTLRGGYNTKGPVVLSSKKLFTHYMEFVSQFRMLIKRVKQRNTEGDTTQGDDARYTMLKTLLYLKGGSVSSTTSCASGRVAPTHRKDHPTALRLVDKPSEGHHYEVYRAISTIRFLRESLHILRMDTVYIFVFFASYVNGILARLQKRQSRNRLADDTPSLLSSLPANTSASRESGKGVARF
ncbi:hypothetical protein AK88_00614 [Plasmodium fragile]|uniref:Uncharacterized protein n=1 Tax=Plasmodium fragile TaxID=5857 RepID=A0A0D9QU23_PLAFR|nr:uncharacterized protein AK88_00614 [Plasmodium fragile]KJP89656.1 hypothetical protein AK88_00614 [Plasmodium fragile]